MSSEFSRSRCRIKNNGSLAEKNRALRRTIEADCRGGLPRRATEADYQGELSKADYAKRTKPRGLRQERRNSNQTRNTEPEIRDHHSPLKRSLKLFADLPNLLDVADGAGA